MRDPSSCLRGIIAPYRLSGSFWLQGAPHGLGLCSTHKDQVNADLLAFFESP